MYHLRGYCTHQRTENRLLNLIFFFLSIWVKHRAAHAGCQASFFQRNLELYLGRTVLELGADGALPGLVTAKPVWGANLKGACFTFCFARRSSFCSGWPRQILNLAYNVDH